MLGLYEFSIWTRHARETVSSYYSRKKTQTEPNENPEETQQKPSHNPAETQTEPGGNREKEKEREKEKPTGDKGLFGHLNFRTWLRVRA